jgi:small ligand-binding sensory domain FIST
MVTLGVNKGDKFGDFREDDYAIHLCVEVDAGRRALLVDNHLSAGVEVQLMRRHIDFAQVRRQAERLLARASGRRPFLAFYIDCTGRTARLAGTDREEAAEVQAAIAGRVPLFGVYSGGEVSSVGGDVQRLTHAGVLCLFSE